MSKRRLVVEHGEWAKAQRLSVRMVTVNSRANKYARIKWECIYYINEQAAFMSLQWRMRRLERQHTNDHFGLKVDFILFE